MRKLILIIALFFVFQNAFSQNSNEIKKVLTIQQDLWNAGNIPAFMEYYWKSDSLKFISGSGVTSGWNATLQRYLKNYPDKATMGTLQFDIQEIDQFSENSAWVLGKWHLKRPTKGDVGGFFTLIFKKINGEWRIISDHTS
jgi:ketosteroid isomerase-like protein